MPPIIIIYEYFLNRKSKKGCDTHDAHVSISQAIDNNQSNAH